MHHFLPAVLLGSQIPIIPSFILYISHTILHTSQLFNCFEFHSVLFIINHHTHIFSCVSFDVILLYFIWLLLFFSILEFSLDFLIASQSCYYFCKQREHVYLKVSLQYLEPLGTVTILYFVFLQNQVVFSSHVYDYLWMCYWHRIFKIVWWKYVRKEMKLSFFRFYVCFWKSSKFSSSLVSP